MTPPAARSADPAASQEVDDLGAEVTVGFVSTYPPMKCGIASFTESLRQAMASPLGSCRLGVVSCVDEPGARDHPPEVVAELVGGSAESIAAAAAALAAFDVVVVQHEFGIFGGKDGREVVELAALLKAPTIVVLHTILRRPSPCQRTIVEQLAGTAEFVVVLSETARARLLAAYEVVPERVRVIPHGAQVNLTPATSTPPPRRRATILTWGLIGRDKGIEFAIEALAPLRSLQPPPRYVVLGQTHPRVLSAEGEVYRNMLVERARAFGVDDLVEFDNHYPDTSSLLERVRAADIVLLPYRSREQDVSGVLVQAIASGKPVVATRFPHAVELVGKGCGILVPHEDPAAIADALRSLLTEPALAARLAAVARRQAQAHDQEDVGHAYAQLVLAAAGARVSVTS